MEEAQDQCAAGRPLLAEPGLLRHCQHTPRTVRVCLLPVIGEVTKLGGKMHSLPPHTKRGLDDSLSLVTLWFLYLEGLFLITEEE